MGLESYLAVCLRGCGRDAPRAPGGARRPADGGRGGRRGRAADLRLPAAAELERRRQAAALEASRTRAIEAADAERRRIGRDLHDGAQQRLMAVANFLTVARKKAGPSEPLLDQAAEELSAANAELRDLARGLYPGRARRARAEGRARDARGGLRGAGRARCAGLELPRAGRARRRTSSSARRWRTSRATPARTARGCARRSRTRRCVVEVRRRRRRWRRPGRGHGLRGLADRMQILGGSLDVTSPRARAPASRLASR